VAQTVPKEGPSRRSPTRALVPLQPQVSLRHTAAGTAPTGRPAVAGLVYMPPIAVAGSIGAAAGASRLGAGACVVRRRCRWHKDAARATLLPSTEPCPAPRSGAGRSPRAPKPWAASKLKRQLRPVRNAAGTTPTGSLAPRCRTLPYARPPAPGRRLRRRAVAQYPGHGDQARSPLVPVLAPLRVTPPVRSPHPHDKIRTRVRLVGGVT
jgi:hypothetical protein